MTPQLEVRTRGRRHLHHVLALRIHRASILGLSGVVKVLVVAEAELFFLE